jgi:SP family general alpha glucoside:H+ symporter-like MFS transporter
MVNHILQDDQDKPVVVPTVDIAAFGGFEGKDAAQMLAAAEEADRVDHELGIRQALRKYKVAVFWAMFLSCALIMEGYDVVVIGSFYGQPQFIKRFGSVGSDGVMAIQGMSCSVSPSDSALTNSCTAKWQTALSNSSVCGQLIGLALNGFAQDRFGCRPTYIVGMIWMAAVIFIPVFANSMGMLIAGEVLCGTFIHTCL